MAHNELSVKDDRMYDAGYQIIQSADKSLARSWNETSYSETMDRIYGGGTIRLYKVLISR